MIKRTHISETNGYMRGALIDTVLPYPDKIRHSLNRLNGTSSWGYSLWRAPEGANLRQDIPLSDVYLQSAGTAEALTIETRVLGEDGEFYQYTVGKKVAVESGSPSEVITWDDGRYSTTVYPHEVFTADEAAEVFYEYFLTDTVSDAYTLRELNLTKK